MKFIRIDGQIYDVEHKETIERLQADNNFKELEQLSINELRSYAERVGLNDFEDMGKDELIKSINNSSYTNYSYEIANNHN